MVRQDKIGSTHPHVVKSLNILNTETPEDTAVYLTSLLQKEDRNMVPVYPRREHIKALV